MTRGEDSAVEEATEEALLVPVATEVVVGALREVVVVVEAGTTRTGRLMTLILGTKVTASNTMITIRLTKDSAVMADSRLHSQLPMAGPEAILI
jgi:hypothetical protein